MAFNLAADIFRFLAFAGVAGCACCLFCAAHRAFCAAAILARPALLIVRRFDGAAVAVSAAVAAVTVAFGRPGPGWPSRSFEGDEEHPPDAGAIFLWITDQPELNIQTRDKMRATSHVLSPATTVEISADFDQETFPAGKVYFLNTQELAEAQKQIARDWTVFLGPAKEWCAMHKCRGEP